MRRRWRTAGRRRFARVAAIDCSLAPTIIGRPPAPEATSYEMCIILRKSLPSMEDTIAIDGIEFTNSRAPAGLVRRDQSRARAAEKIEHDAAPARNVFDGVGDHCNRLDSRMERKLIEPAGFRVLTPRYSQTFVR